MSAVTLQGVGQRHGNVGTLVLSELVGCGIEVDACDRIGAIDALAHLDGIEIDLHDAFLAPNAFNQEREIGFQALAQP